MGGGAAPTAPVAPGAGECTGDAGFRSVSARPRGRKVRISFTRRLDLPVRVDVFQVSHGRRVISERLVARFNDARSAFTWNGRKSNGYYFVRFMMRNDGKRVDTRRIVLRRKGAKFRSRSAITAAATARCCAPSSSSAPSSAAAPTGRCASPTG